MSLDQSYNELDQEHQDTKDKLNKAILLIRGLRDHIFYNEHYLHAHEREWESEYQERQRELVNRDGKLRWDKETDRIIGEL